MNKPLTDSELIAAADASAAAFMLICFNYAKCFGTNQDVLQEARLLALEHVATCNPIFVEPRMLKRRVFWDLLTIYRLRSGYRLKYKPPLCLNSDCVQIVAKARTEEEIETADLLQCLKERLKAGELEVLEMLLQGHKPPSIARELGRSLHCVRARIRRIREKTKALYDNSRSPARGDSGGKLDAEGDKRAEV